MPTDSLTTHTRATTFGPVTVVSDDRVLEPRPWTLLQSRWAAELAAVCPPGPILELCSGAGQIGLAAAKLSGRRLVQLDRDPHACAFARANAARNDVDAEVHAGPLRRSGAHLGARRFPLVLADPPYVPSSQIGEYPDDPRHAIDGGADGLGLVWECLEAGRRHAGVDAAVLLQLRGEAQAAEVATLLARERPSRFVVEAVRAHDPRRAVALLRVAA